MTRDVWDLETKEKVSRKTIANFRARGVIPEIRESLIEYIVREKPFIVDNEHKGLLHFTAWTTATLSEQWAKSEREFAERIADKIINDKFTPGRPGVDVYCNCYTKFSSVNDDKRATVDVNFILGGNP